MIDLQSALLDFWNRLTSVFNSVRIRDFIDVAVVAYIIYHAIRLIRETRAVQLLKGIAAILVLYFIADTLEMLTLRFFIQNVLQVGIFVLVVLFQPELRSALERMGRSNLALRFGGAQFQSAEEARRAEALIDVLAESCSYLSDRKTGALIAIERQTKLGDVIKTGTVIDSAPSLELIANIFFINTPLHDGAMILRNGRLYAAGCYLPLSQNTEIGRDLGTRHRAALGLSEVSDAVVIVVSEETGAVSVAVESRLQRGLSHQNLKKLLHLKLVGAETKEQPEKKAGFWKVK